MAFKIVDCDNVRESFTSTGTTITAGGAIANFRALSAVLANGDTFFGVARKGAEFSVGIFTWTTGGSIAQTTVFYSSNSNSAVSFSSGSGEIFMDAPSRLFDELNLSAITVASASTTDIGAVQAGKVIVSGTTTITSFGTTVNKRRFVHFSGALTLTHNATSLILPGGANITTAAGDTAIFMSDSSGNWRCYSYQRAGNDIQGVTNGSSAAAGAVGEFLSAARAVGSAISLTSGAWANITSISLTPGDWDLFGTTSVHASGTTILSFRFDAIDLANNNGTATASPTGATGTTNGYPPSYAPNVNADQAVTIPTTRISISTTTTFYLNIYASFSNSTLTAYGMLSARRRR